MTDRAQENRNRTLRRLGGMAFVAGVAALLAGGYAFVDDFAQTSRPETVRQPEIIAASYETSTDALATDLWVDLDPGTPSTGGTGSMRFPYRVTLPLEPSTGSVTLQWAFKTSLGTLLPCSAVDSVTSGLTFNELPQGIRTALSSPVGGRVPGGPAQDNAISFLGDEFVVVSITDDEGELTSADVHGAQTEGLQFASTLECPFVFQDAWRKTLAESQYVSPTAVFAFPGSTVDTYASSQTVIAASGEYFYSRGTLDPTTDGSGKQLWSGLGDTLSARDGFTTTSIAPYFIRLESDADTDRQQFVYVAYGALAGVVGSLVLAILSWLVRLLYRAYERTNIG